MIYGGFISQSYLIWLSSCLRLDTGRIKTHMEENKQVFFNLKAWFRFLYESCVTGLENLEVTEILVSKKLSKKHLPVTQFT